MGEALAIPAELRALGGDTIAGGDRLDEIIGGGGAGQFDFVALETVG